MPGRKRSNVPLYVRIAETFTRQVATGVLRPGDRVPSNLPIDGHSFRRVEVLTGTPRRRPGRAAGDVSHADPSAAQGPKVRRLFAGGRWIRTIGPRHERAGFCCGRRIAGPNGGSQKGLFLMRYRWFESISLQQRVGNELFLPPQAIGLHGAASGRSP